MSDNLYTHALGTIADRVQTDKWNNPVSIITLADGRNFRMVHHPDRRTGSYAWTPLQLATIYAGRGKSIRVRTYSPQRDTVATECNVAGYSVAWGDGDNLGVDTERINLSIPAAVTTVLCAQLRELNEDFEEVILTVLTAIVDIPEAWYYKDMPSTEAVHAA